MNINLGKIGPTVIGVVIMIAGIGVVMAQLPSEDALRVTQEVYDNLLSSADADAYRLQYRVRTTVVQDSVPYETVADIDYVATPNRMHLVSQEYSLYQDSAISVVVMSQDKSLFISPSSSEKLRTQQRKLVEGMRDSLFSQGRVLDWKELEPQEGRESDRVLILKPSEKVSRLTMVDTVMVFLNEKKKSLQKVRLSYLDKSGVESIEMEYGNLTKIEEPEEFKESVLNLFFDEKNQLLPDYAGYTVNDMRGSRPRFPKRVQ